MNRELYEQLVHAAIIVLRRKQYDEQVAEKEKRINQELATLNSAKEKIDGAPEGYGAKIGWGRFLVIVSSIFLFSAIGNLLGNFQLIVLLLCGIGIPIILIFLGLGIILLILAKKAKAKYRIAMQAEYERMKVQVTEPTILALNDEIAKIKEEKARFNKLYASLIAFLPQKYQNMIAVCYMLEFVQNLRASTLTDAINLYEKTLLDEALLAQAKQQQLQNNRILNALQEIESNQQTIHSDLQNIQIMQFYDIINKTSS